MCRPRLKPEAPAAVQTETVSAVQKLPAIIDSTSTIDRSMGGSSAAQPGVAVAANQEPGVPVGTGFLAAIGRVPAVLQDWAEPKGRFSKLQWGLIGAAPILLVLALGVKYWPQGSKAEPAVPAAIEYFVDLESNVANATYRVDGNPPSSLPLRLKQGEHTAEAFLPGYKPARITFTLAPGVAKPFRGPAETGAGTGEAAAFVGFEVRPDSAGRSAAGGASRRKFRERCNFRVRRPHVCIDSGR